MFAYEIIAGKVIEIGCYEKIYMHVSSNTAIIRNYLFWC